MYFLMKPHTLDVSKHLTKNVKRAISIKYDGMRALWDGGVTRGMTDVPFAMDIESTGLWSINGNVICAPDWFLDHLPKGQMADGELWAGPGQFQKVMSICRSFKPDDRWFDIRYMCFDSPSPSMMWSPRSINTPNCKINITYETMAYFRELYDTKEWVRSNMWLPPQHVFDSVENAHFIFAEQYAVEGNTASDREAFINGFFESRLAEGHEGIVLRTLSAPWIPDRTTNILKYKPYKDSEARVVGVKFAEKGKYDGMLGSLICRWGTTLIYLSGMKDSERQLSGDLSRIKNGQCDTSGEIFATSFPIGTIVNFRYRELSDSGQPKDPRFSHTRKGE